MTSEEAINLLDLQLHGTPEQIEQHGSYEHATAIRMAIEALKAEPCKDRMKYVQETVNTMLNTCTTNSIKDKVFRNAARFVQNAIDGKEPDFEKIDEPEPREDCVSRQAVLNYIRDNYRRWFINDDAFMQCVNGIKDFISVTPKPTECEDAVSREAVLRINELHHGQMPNHINHQIWEEVKALPPVTPKQKTAKWIYVSGQSGSDMYDDAWYHTYKCSECGRTVKIDSQRYKELTEKYPYCHCGAKMEGMSE